MSTYSTYELPFIQVHTVSIMHVTSYCIATWPSSYYFMVYIVMLYYQELLTLDIINVMAKLQYKV